MRLGATSTALSKGLIRSACMTVLTPLLLATTVFAGGVQVKIQMLTASEAALGAPVAYNFTVTNGDTVKHNLTSTVTMTAPDGTTYNVYTSNLQGYPPGNSVTYTPNSLTTSSYTSQTGTFTLTANASELGTLRGSNSIMFTVVPAPASGYYVSVGGAGPDPALLGMKYDFQAVTANLTGATQTLTTKYTLVYPDGTQTVFVKSTTNTLTAGASAINKGSVTTTQWTGTTGTFGVRADVFNGSSLVATSTQTITRNALAATAYPPTFTDATAAAGVNHPNMMGMACTNGMMMMMGQGVAVGDYDNDGWDDMYVTDGMGMGFLWHNNGVDANGNFLGFTDMSMEAMIPMVMNAAAANFVDYDNDGNPDLLILTTDSMNVLLHNDGNGMFSDVSDTVGLPFRSYGDTFSSAATWGDYDGDGYPDLYITAWGDCMKMNKQDHLYHNEHGTGFTDVSNLLNNTGPQLSRPGLAAVFFDYNGDGRVDLFVGNDAGGPSVLWKNNGLGSDGKWSFTDVSATARANTAISSMGIAIGDYNRDGLFDVFQTNAGYNNLLQQKAGNAFTQVQTAANVGRNSVPFNPPTTPTYNNVTWGTGFYDFNNDGWEDLFLGGGNTTGRKPTVPNLLLLNNQDGTFLDLTLPQDVLGAGVAARTVVFADFNKDGFVDIFESEMGEPPILYLNTSRTSGDTYHYLEVKLIGNSGGTPPSNRDALGARLVASVGGATLLRTVYNGATFEGNNSLVTHFGLGTATKVDTLTITWPSGKQTILTDVLADQFLTISEP